MTTFVEYIKGRRITDTPNGEFVRDVRRDARFPDAGTWDEIEAYLRSRNAIPDAIKAGRDVWRQYEARHLAQSR